MLTKQRNESDEYIIPSEMDIAKLTNLEEVKVESESVPTPEKDEVLIKVMAVGICGSDVHYYAHGRIGKREVIYPHVQGHEFSGIVVAKGEDVTKFNIGDRVVAEPGVSCMNCEWCKSGKYNLCLDMKFLSTPPYKGAFTQYVKHKEGFVFPISEKISYESGTLAEPLAVGIHVMKRGNVAPGMKVLISGMGPVGLLAVVAAKAFGAKEIIVSDLVPLRLETAKSLGATHCIEISKQNINQEVQAITEDTGVDVVIETSGNDGALSTAVDLVKRGGIIVAVGFPANDVPFDVVQMMQKEVDLKTIYRYRNTFPQAIDLLESLGDEVNQFFTGKYPLQEIQTAMNDAHTNGRENIKIILYPNNKKY